MSKVSHATLTVCRIAKNCYCSIVTKKKSLFLSLSLFFSMEITSIQYNVQKIRKILNIFANFVQLQLFHFFLCDQRFFSEIPQRSLNSAQIARTSRKFGPFCVIFSLYLVTRPTKQSILPRPAPSLPPTKNFACPRVFC